MSQRPRKFQRISKACALPQPLPSFRGNEWCNFEFGLTDSSAAHRRFLQSTQHQMQ
ncbi:hypothetical protein BDW74DRAFT_141349 [Aspergillus multicolor]|uniref:uncharacterized protein n=1 Tax=Aspergillus multicolor TaxID=41759 RepID=UPI003CCD7565